MTTTLFLRKKMAVISTARKFRIKEGDKILTLNAPASYSRSLGPLPDGVSHGSGVKQFDQIHWFVQNRAQMERELDKVMSQMGGKVLCWIFFPKGSSGIQTDLTRDKGWEKLHRYNLQWLTLVSFDDTWSAFCMRTKTEADKKKESQPSERIIFDYIDPKTKTVQLPEDLIAVFKKHKKEEAYFQSLPFTHKKEYVEWIVTAKRPETREKRILGTIERLSKQWKNPSNR